MSEPATLQRQRRTICQQGQQRGTTMIEVMVAALVLSAGLLGLAAMQTTALKTASGLATQQSMVQALGAFGEARLANVNSNIVGGTGPGGENFKQLAAKCDALWAAVGATTFDNTTSNDLNFIKTFLAQYTSCESTALTEYADYWNQYGVYGTESTTNGAECDYVVPRTRTVGCTLPTGDVISLQNWVWVR